MKHTIIILFSLILMLVSFQNCSKIQVTKLNDGLELTSSIDEVLVETDFETPVEFNLPQKKVVSGLVYEFLKGSSSSIRGNFKVLNADAMKLLYTPAQGFRGIEKVIVNTQDLNRDKITFRVTIRVGNPLSRIEPALAVRGVGCILCHANIKSNIITDFGFGSNYFFGSNSALPWNNGNIYGNHAENMRSMSLAEGKSVVVPNVELPNGRGPLVKYVESELAIGNANTTAKAQKSVYIGAPTEADLVSAFHLGSERFKFYKNESDVSPDLAGLLDSGTFFQAVGDLSCDGDVVIRGPLYLKNLRINTIKGCRLYVIGSVFLYGEIVYANSANVDNNLQITSTRSINVGLGSAFKDGALCDPNTHSETVNSKSSLFSRYVNMWTVPSQFVRGVSDPREFGKGVMLESGLIEAQVGTLYDASCLPEGRTVHYEKLLLNAPSVQSRYTGNFSGTVIAEMAIMALQQFKFEFDTVFKNVPILPLLDSGKYLKIIE